MGAKKSTVPSEKVELYDKLIKTNPKIERKGDANPYTSLNGNMFTLFINPRDWPSGCLRISDRLS